MATVNQTLYNKRIRKKKHCWSPALSGKPQRKGKFIKMVIETPRKPNSALRKVGKIFFFSGKKVAAKIPGSGSIPQKFATVLVQGKGYKDTPGVKYKLIRGAFDCLPLFSKTKRRSIYGVMMPDNYRDWKVKDYLKEISETSENVEDG